MGYPSQFCCWLLLPEFIGWWGERGEVKHLSTCWKRYSVSSGERKWMMAKLRACQGGSCCVRGVVGCVFPFSAGGGGCDKWWCGAEQSGMADRSA